MRVTRMATALVALTILAPQVATANELERATANLKTCAEKHMPDERKKASPSADKILEVCKKELNAVTELVPAGVVDEIRHHIRHDTQTELAKGPG